MDQLGAPKGWRSKKIKEGGVAGQRNWLIPSLNVCSSPDVVSISRALLFLSS